LSVLLEELAPKRHHMVRRDPRFGEDGAVGWSQYWLMNGVVTLRWQAREATTSRAAGSGLEMKGRDWRRRIMRQCEIGERNKDQSRFFLAHKK
jgi:hypothetical protein